MRIKVIQLLRYLKKKKEDDQDPDVLFCLCLVTSMKQLTARKKQYARMKIEELFYELIEET